MPLRSTNDDSGERSGGAGNRLRSSAVGEAVLSALSGILKNQLLASLLLVLTAVAVGTVVIRAVSAATYQQPQAQPPQGNIPTTVWNPVDAFRAVGINLQQQDASINVDGGGPPPAPAGLMVGKDTLDLGAAAGGENVFYGVADFTKMNADDALLMLQTAVPQTPPAPSVYTDRLVVDRDGNVAASGSVNSMSCFGPVFIGITAQKFTGNLNGAAIGYFNANALCQAAFSGSHICSTAEILESIKCATSFPPHLIKNAAFDNSDAWIQDGPPGYTAPANDCRGWSSNQNNHLGRIWRFDSATGGQGFLTTCNQDIAFACCK